MFWPVLCMFDVWLMLFFGRLKFWVVQLSRTLSDSEWTFDFGTSDKPLVCRISVYLLVHICLFPYFQPVGRIWDCFDGTFGWLEILSWRVSVRSGKSPESWGWRHLRGFLETSAGVEDWWRPFILWLNIFVTVAFYINFLLIIITVAFYINKFKVNKFGL